MHQLPQLGKSSRSAFYVTLFDPVCSKILSFQIIRIFIKKKTPWRLRAWQQEIKFQKIVAGGGIILKKFFFSFSYPQYRPQRKSQNFFGGCFLSLRLFSSRKKDYSVISIAWTTFVQSFKYFWIFELDFENFTCKSNL